MAHPQYLNTHSVTDSPFREYISVSQKTYVFLFLYSFMIDHFSSHYYVAKSYGLEREFVDTYKFFRRQGVSRPFAAYYAAQEWDI